MRTLELAPGIAASVIGQGTWRMGERAAQRTAEIRALQAGVDLGLTLVDTAEMYGEGETESLVGEALAGRRDQVCLVSKAYPQNASRSRLARACEDSLKRLRTDRLDLYLLHWRGSVPLSETAEAMEALKRDGKIRAWGVSNLDLSDMEELGRSSDGCATDQILYNLTRRGPEFDLLPALEDRGVTVMAYSPAEQGRLRVEPALERMAARHGVTPYQVALAWTVRRPNVVAIPKASSLDHLRDNLAAAEVTLSDEDLAELDRAYPPPNRRKRLEML